MTGESLAIAIAIGQKDRRGEVDHDCFLFLHSYVQLQLEKSTNTTPKYATSNKSKILLFAF